MSGDELVIPAPFDGHVHLRQGEMMRTVVPATASQWEAGIVMPNTTPIISTAERAREYRAMITSIAPFNPYMALYLTEQTKPSHVAIASRYRWIRAFKMYMRPEDSATEVTTNSGHGVRYSRLGELEKVFRAMMDYDFVLCLHMEWPDPRCPPLDREIHGHMIYRAIRQFAPMLHIVIEHISDRRSIPLVEESPHTAATITAHHLRFTAVDWKVSPLCRCAPLAKSEYDRAALVAAVLSGHRRIFAGTDSAPHSLVAKYGPNPPYGVYSAPTALAYYAEIFHLHGLLDETRFGNFVSNFGRAFYGLAPSQRGVQLVPRPWQVPVETHGLAPFLGGTQLNWRPLPLI